MGLMTAMDLAGQEISLEQQLAIHFSSNCYPPIPQQMIPMAVEAIGAYWDEELDKEIELPEGMSFRGRDTVSARNVIESYRLDAWCMETESCGKCEATGEGTSAWGGWCHDCDNQEDS